jgi:hypothetical protein
MVRVWRRQLRSGFRSFAHDRRMSNAELRIKIASSDTDFALSELLVAGSSDRLDRLWRYHHVDGYIQRDISDSSALRCPSSDR